MSEPIRVELTERELEALLRRIDDVPTDAYGHLSAAKLRLQQAQQERREQAQP